MKSTGLFGKNSGRVGGVVYSNYRGEQVVRAYQPKVSNPNTPRQIEQRAKFKLASQVATSLRRSIDASFAPTKANESSRNAFIREMLKKTSYTSNNARLPIEEIVLTNSKINGFFEVQATASKISGTISSNFGNNVEIRIVYIAYDNGGQIVPFATNAGELEEVEGRKMFEATTPTARGFNNLRALIYAYEPDTSAGTSYKDYEMQSENATLEDILKMYQGRVIFSATENVSIPQNV